MATEPATPMTMRIGMRTHQRERSMPRRLESRKMRGVKAAQSHDSMNVSAIGPAGETARMPPKPRGSSRRLTADTVASDVQKTKMKRSSRPLR